MKVYSEPITVQPAHGMPRYIEWRGRMFTVVEMIDFWVAEGEWWAEPMRRNYLLLETDNGMLELYQSGTHWFLSRMYD